MGIQECFFEISRIYDDYAANNFCKSVISSGLDYLFA